jgi:hypothetical protein
MSYNSSFSSGQSSRKDWPSLQTPVEGHFCFYWLYDRVLSALFFTSYFGMNLKGIINTKRTEVMPHVPEYISTALIVTWFCQCRLRDTDDQVGKEKGNIVQSRSSSGAHVVQTANLTAHALASPPLRPIKRQASLKWFQK